MLVALDTLSQHKMDDTAVLLSTAIFLFSIDWLIIKGKEVLGTSILLFSLTLMLSYLAWTGGGIRDSAMLGYCGVLIFAALLGGKRLILWLMAVILSVVAFISYSNYAGWHVNVVEPNNLATGLIAIIVLSVISFAIWILANDYREILHELANENSRVLDAKSQVEYLAMHNPLTLLPNRMQAQKNGRKLLQKHKKVLFEL